MIKHSAQRGFTLLISLILTSVMLAIGLSLMDITYKQTVLGSTARQSQYAFYSADAAMECILYNDQQRDAFNYTTPNSTITCQGQTVTVTQVSRNISTSTMTLSIPCPSSGSIAQATIYKASNGRTLFYTRGYNTCTASDPRRIARALRVNY